MANEIPRPVAMGIQDEGSGTAELKVMLSNAN